MNNTVELIGTYGNDLTHACSAWTSTSRDLTENKVNRVDKLLSMLAREGHHTPFEKSSIHFLVKTDIATHIHLLKHRIGVSINAESARYKELREDTFYIPSDWGSEEQEAYSNFMENALQQYHDTLNRLVSKGIPRKRAKESARLYLPYGKQLTADIMFNWRSFYHFLKLRYSKHAQLEVREVAKKMLQAVIEQGDFPLTIQAFNLVKEDGSIINPFE